MLRSLFQKVIIASSTILPILLTMGTARASTLNEQIIPPPIEITSYSTTASNSQALKIDPKDNEFFTIHYCVNKTANAHLGVYKAGGHTRGYQKVAVVSEKYFSEGGCTTSKWYGRADSSNELGLYTGEIVPDGQYYYGIFADDPYSNQEDYKSEWIYIDSDSNNNDDSDNDDSDDDQNTDEDEIEITDVDIENRTFDPYENERVEIEFELNRDAEVTITIYDEDDDRVKTIKDERRYDEGTHSVYWQGEDRFGDIVDEDDYYVEILAEAEGEEDEVQEEITVDYDSDDNDDDSNDDYNFETKDPRLKDVYVTKESFDPGRREETHLVFILTAEADMQVGIYDEQGDLVEELVDSNNREPGVYKIPWDGEDFIEFEKEFSFKIFVENKHGEDSETIEFEVDEDIKHDKKPNLYKDIAEETPFNPEAGKLPIDFTVDKDAEITIEIRDRDNIIDTFAEARNVTAGHHTFYWDGKDKYGSYVEPGVYEYKIIAGNFNGKDVEKGNFSVWEKARSNGRSRDDYDDPLDPDDFGGNGPSCADFYDVSESYSYCAAIEWAKKEGIFEGYIDGSFQPNRAISRVEALKVIIETLNINTITSSGRYFPDTPSNAWYQNYIVTGINLGVIEGYPDGLFRPNNTVIRAEALAMLLRTGESQGDITIPLYSSGKPYVDTPNQSDTKWYLKYAWFARNNDLTPSTQYFYPSDYMSRGEMADMLYRYYLAGLID